MGRLGAGQARRLRRFFFLLTGWAGARAARLDGLGRRVWSWALFRRTRAKRRAKIPPIAPILSIAYSGFPGVRR